MILKIKFINSGLLSFSLTSILYYRLRIFSSKLGKDVRGLPAIKGTKDVHPPFVRSPQISVVFSLPSGLLHVNNVCNQ